MLPTKEPIGTFLFFPDLLLRLPSKRGPAGWNQASTGPRRPHKQKHPTIWYIVYGVEYMVYSIQYKVYKSKDDTNRRLSGSPIVLGLVTGMWDPCVQDVFAKIQARLHFISKLYPDDIGRYRGPYSSICPLACSAQSGLGYGLELLYGSNQGWGTISDKIKETRLRFISSTPPDSKICSMCLD